MLNEYNQNLSGGFMDDFEGGKRSNKKRKNQPGYVENRHGKWVLKSRMNAGLRLYRKSKTVQKALALGSRHRKSHKKSKSRK